MAHVDASGVKLMSHRKYCIETKILFFALSVTVSLTFLNYSADIIISKIIVIMPIYE